MDIFSELGVLAVASRMQRLSELLRRDALMIYGDFGIDFQPKWFPVVHALQRKGPMTIAAIAADVGFAHPSVIQLVNELEDARLVRSTADARDGRKRVITLTMKAANLLARMGPAWEVMRTALADLLDTKNNLLKALDEVEERMEEEGFHSRALREMERRTLPA